MTVQTRRLSIEDWHALACSGSVLPMRIPINGVSMYPLIRINRDMVTIMPVTAPLNIGDIVMFADPSKKRYVLHRLWKMEGGKVLTWGDNCYGPDAPMTVDCVWGVAVKIERGNKTILPDPVKGMRHAKCWHKVMRIYNPLRAKAGRLWHGFKRMIGTEKCK